MSNRQGGVTPPTPPTRYGPAYKWAIPVAGMKVQRYRRKLFVTTVKTT